LFIALLIAHAIQTGVPMPAVTTAKSLNDFGRCFTAFESQQHRPWSFVPNVAGGVFSNRGATGVVSAYELLFREGEHRNAITLSGDDQAVGQIRMAVKRCR
jgi:hypothetical protein